MNKYHFKFRMGFNTIKESECLFSEARKIGNELANEHGKIEYLAFNDRTLKWHYMGEFIGNMNVIDSFGCLCRISDDFQRLIAIKEGGEQ